MAIVAADWTVTRATKVIAYTGHVHTGENPSYATVIEFHRWLQGLADDAVATPASSDQLDVTNIDPSRRSTDNIITLINGYTIDQTSSSHLYDGSVIQGTSGSDIWDGIVNFGNKGVLIQLHQDGSVVTDDWWNYSLGGSATSDASATVVTDSALSTALTNRGLIADSLIGYTLYNVTDGSHGIITTNTTGTITVAGLFGGTANTFAVSDVYKVGIGVNRAVTSGISHRWMQKVRTAGADTDLRKLLGTNRRFGYTYGEFSINATSRGNNVLALSDSADLNNTTSETTVSGWLDVCIDRTASTATVNGINAAGQAVLNVSDGTQFTDGDFIMVGATDNSEYKITSIAANALTLNRNLVLATVDLAAIYDLNIGYRSLDVDNNAVNENYYAVWDRGAKTINQFYEYTKYQTADGSIEQVYGLNGELFRGITHEIVVDTQSATDFDAVEGVSWSGGTGQMLAINDRTGSSTKMWIQLLTGVAPTDEQTITGANSGATAVVETGVTAVLDRSVSKPFVGVSTGSALIGSYGLALQTADLSSSDRVTDLTNAVISPPNNVTNIVAGLTNVASQEDRVLVGPWDGSTYDVNGDPAITKTQLTLDTALVAADITSVVVNEAIPSDTPPSGYIRVIDNNGFERRLHYTAWATSTFTVDTSDGNEDFNVVGAAINNNVWIAYIDYLYDGTSATDRFTSVQTGSRNLVVIVRNGTALPIKQFISSWTQTSSNQTITAIRTTDV